MFSLLYWAVVIGLLLADKQEKWDSWGRHPTAGYAAAYLVIMGIIWLIIAIALHVHRAAVRREQRATLMKTAAPADGPDPYQPYAPPVFPYGEARYPPGYTRPSAPAQGPARQAPQPARRTQPVYAPPPAAPAPTTAGATLASNQIGPSGVTVARNTVGGSGLAGYTGH